MEQQSKTKDTAIDRNLAVSSRYLIKAKKDSLGWKVTLYKRFLWLWIPDTVSIVKIGYEYKVNWQIDEWVETFKIPRSFVKVQV